MNLNAKILALMVNDNLPVRNEICGDSGTTTVFTKDDKVLAIVRNGIVSSMPKEKVIATILKLLAKEERCLSKFWGDTLATEFAEKTNGMAQRFVDKELTESDLEILNKIL
ncbi:hypothetical protein Ac42p002 [Acinetobacter phage Ac42]|uniref:hypothetical protein n=1 Tax=Acinetobacter phage Ac42 TaxID=762660 RepID=UPI0001EBCC64|nr:hypothetical protein Ac42p002 [Acinetobacter phage Ac42]ADI96240.1 hypothetical protein Ac42p002 [Acinetobacter phage Ac42]